MITRYATILVSLVAGFISGAAFNAGREPIPARANYDMVQLATSRKVINSEVVCPKPDPGTVVVAPFGQSNAANYGGINWYPPLWGTSQHTAKGNVIALDWRDGKCYQGDDPLPGAEGEGGSIWGRMADLLIQRGEAKTVVIASFGVGSTFIADWTDDAPVSRLNEVLRDRLDKVQKALTLHGYHASIVPFQQGESDISTPGGTYLAKLRLLSARSESIFGQKLTVPFSTLCQGPPHQHIQAAIQQAAFAGAVHIGPDFDSTLNGALDRQDRCHFSGNALDKAASMWADTVASQSQMRSNARHP